MKIKTKRILIVVCVIVFLCVISLVGYRWYRATWRYPYSPETRKINWPIDAYMYAYAPSMETNLRLGDTVVRGVITSDGVESNIPDYDGTEYTFKVTEHLMGATTPETITVCFWGDREYGVAHPYRNDELVMILSYKTSYDVYIPTNDEDCMFAVMPENSLYSFSTAYCFTGYDYQPAEDLYTGILEASVNIRDNPDEYEDTFAPGDILDGLLDPQSDILAPLESIVESAS